ncbi:MAG: hypothetical protein SGI74_03190 [Oligoflexia bacterium]|nr:hypothetical protein [Oligoflexia bacterium]
MRTLVVIALLHLGVLAHAQEIDPSFLGLMGDTQSPTARRPVQPQTQDSTESSRYIRKSTSHKKKDKTAQIQNRRPAQDDGETVFDRPIAESAAPNVAPLPGLGGENFNNASAPPAEVTGKKAEDSGMGTRMRDMLLGGELEEIDKYRSFLDSEDIRKNLFEFTISPSYIYNSSVSPYYYRNYINQSPGAFFGLNLWFTPFLGIVADYRFSMLNELKDNPTQDIYVASSHTWFNLGLKFRRFFGMALNSSSLAFTLKYADYSLSLPPNVGRLKHGLGGVEIDIDMSIPSSKSYFWNLGLMVQPYMVHTEKVGSADVRAGQSNQTIGVGANIGGEYRFARQTRTFFKVSAIMYKSQFSGSANKTDPNTSMVPTNVPVSNVFYLFDFGVTFGR